jgi:hypothetical protein
MGQGAAGATGGLSGIGAIAGGPIGMGVAAAANIGLSLVEASKQKELQRAADRQAEKSAAEQERLMSQNFFEALQVPMEAYDREFRETTAQQQQAMAALQEGDPRLLLGGVGKVQAIAAEQEAKTRDALGQDLFDLGKLQAQEAGQTADQLANLEGQRLAGAQEASAAAQMAKLQNQQRAISAGGDLLKGLGGLIPEYSDTGDGVMTGTGSSVFNDQLKYQSGNFLPEFSPAPVGFGQSKFNRFAPAFTIPTLYKPKG